jgi:hypothetical protein
MFRQVRYTLLFGGLALVACDRAASAGHFFHRHHEGTPPPGCPRVFDNSPARTGDPLCVSHHARPTHLPAYVGYYVGGGSACGGCDRRIEEGTWGRDYEGVLLPRHVWLRWTHGGRYQGGTGAYDPDGPHVPDVIGLTIATVENHGH